MYRFKLGDGAADAVLLDGEEVSTVADGLRDGHGNDLIVDITRFGETGDAARLSSMKNRDASETCIHTVAVSEFILTTPTTVSIRISAIATEVSNDITQRGH